MYVFRLFRILFLSIIRFFWICFCLFVLVNVSLEDEGLDYLVMVVLRVFLYRLDDIDWISLDYCIWIELDCDNNSRVIGIRFFNKGFVGSLFLELVNLIVLRVFEITSN